MQQIPRIAAYTILIGLSFGLKWIPFLMQCYKVTVKIFAHPLMDSILQHAGLAGMLFILYEGFTLMQQLDIADKESILEPETEILEETLKETLEEKQEIQIEKKTILNEEFEPLSEPISEPISVRDKVALFSSLETNLPKINTPKRSIESKLPVISITNIAPSINQIGSNSALSKSEKVQNTVNQSGLDTVKMEPTDFLSRFKLGLDLLEPSVPKDQVREEPLEMMLDQETPLDAMMDDTSSITSSDLTKVTLPFVGTSSFESLELNISAAPEYLLDLPIPSAGQSLMEDLEFKEMDHESMEIDMLDSEKPLPAVMEILGNAPAAENDTMLEPFVPLQLDFGAFSLPRLPTVGRNKQPVMEEIPELEIPTVQSKISRDSAIFLSPSKSMPVIPEKDVHLDFSNQQLDVFPTEEVEDVIVTHLSLEKNRISFIPSFAVTFLKFVKVLNLSDNFLTFIPNEIDQMANLEFLYLRSNELEQLPLCLNRLSQLKIMDVGKNQISSIDYQTFSGMNKLQILDLSSNQLRSLPSSIGLLTSLRTLLIHGNPLDTATSLLAAPLIRSYENISPELTGDVKNHRHPGQGYLFRLQGQLADQYDLDMKQVIKARQKPKRSKLEEFKATFSAHHVDYTNCLFPKSVPVGTSPVRMRVVTELLETEATYVDQLSALLEIYYEPMERILSRSELDLIFSNIRVIHHIHSSIIYPGLIALAASHGQPLGQYFSTICTVLQVYSEYMNSYDYSARFIEFVLNGAKEPTLSSGLMDEGKVEKVVKILELAKSHPKHSQINLISFLILPIQRLPRYKLLLSSLLKETAAQHPDHLKLENAVMDVQKLIEFCNETKRDCEAKSKTLGPLTSINISGCLNLMKQYKPCPDRELLLESDVYFIVKYVDHNDSVPILNPQLLCKNKKSQFQFQQKGSIKEYKFKLHRDSSQSKIARMIEEGGAASKYDVPNIQGKKCSIHVCNDMMLISNNSHQLCGYVQFNEQTTVSCLPLIISREAREGVMRLSNGDGILYIRGELEKVAHLVALINSLL